MNNQAIDIDGQVIREGTSVYDTEYDRVLWIAEITDYELMVEVATPYETDEPVGWSASTDADRVEDGTLFDIDTFRSLVERGRFEIGPGPAGE